MKSLFLGGDGEGIEMWEEGRGRAAVSRGGRKTAGSGVACSIAFAGCVWVDARAAGGLIWRGAVAVERVGRCILDQGR